MGVSIQVQAEHSYEVIFAKANSHSLKAVLEGASKVAIIAPAELSDLAAALESELSHHADASKSKIVTVLVGEGESQKSVQQVEACWTRLSQEHFRRNDAIIALGGGATTDAAGFVAATWLRGIRWAAVPTSLAGMVDAAIGGKTGINTSAGKNLVGAFHSPSVVVIDVHYLNTLPEPELRAGMAEVIKCGFIADRGILDLIENSEDFLEPNSPTLHELIKRAVLVKADVVSQDLRESYLRENLNYGHTLAHAVERHQNYQWRHGDAVAVGLAFIASLSYEIGIASLSLFERHLALLKKAHLPTSYPLQAWDQLLEAMQSDKKARNSGLRFVAVNDKYDVIRLEGVADTVLRRAYERIST